MFPLIFSDHDCVGCVRKMNHERFQYRTITCRNYKTYDSQAMCDELASQDWTEVFSKNCPNLAWACMKGIVTSIFNKHAPFITKRVKGRMCPWLTADLKSHMNERDKLLRKARKSHKTHDWNEYKRKKNYCTRIVRQAKNKYQKTLIEEHQSQPAKFWDLIKHVFPKKWEIEYIICTFY